MQETKKLSAIQTRQQVAKFETELKLKYQKFKQSGPGSEEITLQEGLQLMKEYDKIITTIKQRQ